jgi:hypothetical protein
MEGLARRKSEKLGYQVADRGVASVGLELHIRKLFEAGLVLVVILVLGSTGTRFFAEPLREARPGPAIGLALAIGTD